MAWDIQVSVIYEDSAEVRRLRNDESLYAVGGTNPCAGSSGSSCINKPCYPTSLLDFWRLKYCYGVDGRAGASDDIQWVYCEHKLVSSFFCADFCERLQQRVIQQRDAVCEYDTVH